MIDAVLVLFQRFLAHCFLMLPVVFVLDGVLDAIFAR